jgi:hypothetical protein
VVAELRDVDPEAPINRDHEIQKVHRIDIERGIEPFASLL